MARRRWFGAFVQGTNERKPNLYSHRGPDLSGVEGDSIEHTNTTQHAGETLAPSPRTRAEPQQKEAHR